MIKHLAQYLKNKLGITENKQAIENLRQELNQKHNYLIARQGLSSLAGPFNLHPELKADISKQLEERFPCQGFSTALHPNDMMLAFHLHSHAPDVERALLTYFTKGLELAFSLAQRAKAEQLNTKRILDFGSGYGRLSRFLPFAFPGSQITVSEVKPKALRFQREYFGFETFLHAESPHTVKLPPSDLIIAISVFSHLPEAFTRDWLDHLMKCLAPGGRLFLTYHPAVSGQKEDYWYHAQSEDKLLAHVGEALVENTSYGVSHIKETWFKGFFDERAWSYQFFNHQLTPKQRSLWLWQQ